MIGIQRDRTDARGFTIRPSTAWFEDAKGWTDVALKEKAEHQARSAISHADEQHLTFDVKGRAIAVQGSWMGRTSIAVYHLNRKRLRSQREVRIRLVLDLIHELIGDGLTHSVALTRVTGSLGKSKQAYAGTVRAMRRDPTAFGLPAAE